jgi:hypothetical protein
MDGSGDGVEVPITNIEWSELFDAGAGSDLASVRF